jgi:hypothetical protein
MTNHKIKKGDLIFEKIITKRFSSKIKFIRSKCKETIFDTVRIPILNETHMKIGQICVLFKSFCFGCPIHTVKSLLKPSKIGPKMVVKKLVQFSNVLFILYLQKVIQKSNWTIQSWIHSEPFEIRTNPQFRSPLFYNFFNIVAGVPRSSFIFFSNGAL